MKTIAWCRLAGSLLALSPLSCTTQPSPASAPATPPPVHRLVQESPHLPARGPTTSAVLAVKNLDAQLAQLRSRHEQKRLTLEDGVKLVSLHQLRAMFLGRLEEDEAALALADSLVKAHPKSGLAFHARAKVRQRLHLFKEALADLSRAEALGFDVRRTRIDLLEASEPSPQTLEAIRTDARKQPTFDLLARYGAALASRGELQAADEAYLEAFASYRDVSPFMVAWLEFQHGLLHERMEDWEGTRESWSRAEARLPQYAAAAAHLAELEPSHERAVALVRRAWEQSRDPDYAGQLAALLSKDSPEEASSLLAAAREGYEARVKRHPAAYADHAARFWLKAGKRPERALELALVNLEGRKTAEAHVLLVESAAAAGEATRACASLDALGEGASRELTGELVAAVRAVCSTGARSE